MRSELRARLAGLGRAITPEMISGTAACFGGTAPRPHPALCEVLRDVSYGPHERHRLDVFVPVQGGGPRPVVLFVHGGGFVAGHKGGASDPFHNHVGAWAAANGCVGVTMNYRLAPDHVWPAGCDDVALAAQWLQRNGQVWAGVAEPGVILMGQSAGAAHVAGAVARWPGRVRPPAAAVMLSGLYDLLTLEHSERERLYYGSDVSRFSEQSSLPGLLATTVPTLYTVSELDPPTFLQQAERVVEAHVQEKGVWPEMLYLTGHNHLSNLQAIGGPDDSLGPLLSDFIARCTGLEGGATT